MANSELYNKSFRIPPDVLKYIQATLISNSNGEGVKRAKFMLKNGAVTYQALKRLKNFFDYFNPESGDKVQYALAGGDLMKNFVNKTLNANRAAVDRSKTIKQDMNVDVNRDINVSKINSEMPNLNENKKGLTKNALAVIVNNDNKILLLKRSDYEKQWQPKKWGLVGGGVEKGETPEKACQREIKEEIGLDIDDFKERFSIQRNPDSIEYIFACRYEGDPTDITLNKEHSNYGWYDVEEMNFLDIVPNLIDYINLTFKKY